MTAGPEQRQPALAWLEARPNFELRSPAEQAAARFPLERPAALLDALGRPDRRLRIVLVAGTKGKGSTATFISSILQAHGHRVGLYSQPHLHTMRERLRIDGALITPAQLAEQLDRLRETVEALDAARPELGRLTGYEILTMLGLRWFAERGVDWAVVEVGLGGRLDATNVVTPGVAVITPISYDHTHVLGRRLGQIAGEKAGIVKPGGLVASAPQRPAALKVIRRVCRAQQARLLLVGGEQGAVRARNLRHLRFPADAPELPTEPLLKFDVEGQRPYRDLAIGLGGLHQVDNGLTAIGALELAQERGLQLDPRAVRRGLAASRWPGRLELVSSRPLVVLDGAHNGDSAARLAEALSLHVDYDRLHLVLGVFADKDLPAILRPLRGAHRLIAPALSNARARPAAEVARAARRLGIASVTAGSVAEALEAARSSAQPRDLICATGSLSVVAATREALGLAGPDRVLS